MATEILGAPPGQMREAKDSESRPGKVRAFIQADVRGVREALPEGEIPPD